MKLLFDENLSPRLTELLADVFAGAAHVQSVGLGGASDREVWTFARDQGYLIFTKDSDFQELSLLNGYPPKVVWIRRGNCTTAQIAEVLARHREELRLLTENPEIAVLMLY